MFGQECWISQLAVDILLLSSTFLFNAMGLGFATLDGKHDDVAKHLNLCRESWLAGMSPYKAASGEGIYEVSVDGKDAILASFDVAMNEEKYRVDLRFKVNALKKFTGTLTIIREPGTIFYRESPQPQPDGTPAPTRGVVVNERHPALGAEATLFPFSPIHPIQMIDLANTEERDIKNSRVLDNGDIELRYSRERVFIKIICAKANAYNVTVCEAMRGGQDGPVLARETISWKQSPERWYVAEVIREQSLWADGKSSKLTKRRFYYTKFEPSSTIDRSRFTLDAAGLQQGSRIVDNRAEASERQHLYTNPDGQTREAPILDIIDQLPSSSKPAPKSFSTWIIAANVAGFLLLVSGFIIWLRRARLSVAVNTKQ